MNTKKLDFGLMRLPTNDPANAGDCIGCGQCEQICPQHLPVIQHLKAVSRHFGG